MCEVCRLQMCEWLNAPQPPHLSIKTAARQILDTAYAYSSNCLSSQQHFTSTRLVSSHLLKILRGSL